jgi:aminoglycoside 6'-N-acetyltransferase I
MEWETMEENRQGIRVHAVSPADAGIWLALRCELWPGHDSEHAEEIASFFEGTLKEPAAVFVAELGDKDTVALLELSIRDDVPGARGVRTGYVEGLYVRPGARGQGIARSLLRLSRDWARQQKCAAFASDRAGRIVIDKSF